MKEYLQHSKKIVVTVNDSDFIGQVKPSAIMGYFQDIAVEHAEMIGIGYAKMKSKNLAWVLIRTSYKVLKTPVLGETLTITTFPEKPNKFDVNRSYYIYDASGELVVSGSSKWCVIDLTTFKLQRCAPLFEHFEDSVYIPHQPFGDANPKLNTITEYTEESFKSKVNLTDMDRYLHMNNSRYGDVVLNTCGIDMLKNRRVTRLDANFVSQLFLNDRYESYKATTESVTNIEVRKITTGDIAFRARIEWN